MDGTEQGDSACSAVETILQAAQEFGGFVSENVSSTHQDCPPTAAPASAERVQENPNGLISETPPADTGQVQAEMAGVQSITPNKTEVAIPASQHGQDGVKEITNTETQSLTWGELSLEMLSEIVSQQVISVSQIEGLPPGRGPLCFHMKGIKWKDLVDMIINTHNVMCQQTGVMFSRHTVQIGVKLEGETKQGIFPIYKGSKKVDAEVQTLPDLMSIETLSIKKQEQGKVEVANIETQTSTLSGGDSAKNNKKNHERIENGRLDVDEESLSNQECIGDDTKCESNLNENKEPDSVQKAVALDDKIDDGYTEESQINSQLKTETAQEASSVATKSPSEDTLNDTEIEGPVKGLPAQCPVCKKRFRSRFILRRHSIVHEPNHNRHPCLFCDKVCKTECFLQRHMTTHFKPQKTPQRRRRKPSNKPTQAPKPAKPKQPAAQCTICNKTFTIARNLKRHEKIHLKSNKHPCPHCDKICRSAHYLQLHMMVHAEEKRHKCLDCGVSFGAKHKLKQHRTKEHKVFEQHVCNVCGAVYKHKETLNDHMMEHTSKTSYLCEMCGKTFHRPSVYRLHLAYHASRANLEAHPCTHCSKSYATKGLLNKHVRSAHLKERNHKCSVCGIGFFSRQQLNSHQQVHSDTPAYLCTFCGKGFAQKHTFIAHRRMHTGYRPFICRYCSKGFTSKPHLVKHEKIHTSNQQPERPFKCKVCNATFSNRTAWSDHEKRHAGIKDHKCEFCFVGFVTRGDLIRHLRTHTGGKPFKCEHCDERFSKKLELTEHEVSHDFVEIPITVTLLNSQ